MSDQLFLPRKDFRADRDQNRRNAQALEDWARQIQGQLLQILQAILPTGAIVPFGGDTAPDYFLLADGSAVSRTTYANLFAVYGIKYGAGDGSTTFNLPNFKGRVLVGRDPAQAEFDVLGETGGAKTHALTGGETGVHAHGQDAHNHQQGGAFETYFYDPFSPNFSPSVREGTNPAVTIENWDKVYMPNATPAIHNAGNGTAHNNLQPYQVVNCIIKT